MPLSFPSTPTNGQTYTAPNGTLWQFDGVKWIVVLGNAVKLFSGAKITLTTAALLTSTSTAVDWDAETYDVGDYYTSTAASRITVTSVGYYRVNGVFYTGPNGTGSSYSIIIKKNGSTTLSSSTVAANQTAVYDEVLSLNAGDYIEVFASETNNAGSLLTGTFLEVTRAGYAPGLGISTSDTFSGARVVLSANVNMTTSATAVPWTSADYNVNADATGATYWTVSDASKVTVKMTGYYRIKTTINTGSAGSENSYTILLKKNNSNNITTATLGPNQIASIDEIYNFTANDYIQIVASNAGNVGTVLSSSYLEIFRQGV